MAKMPPDTRELVDFFLNLFQLQVAGKSEKISGARAALVSEKPGEDSIYEFYIRYRGALKSRRMSIRSLGEQVGSKSSCFKVIYDDLLVVKIPPRPITDFDTYLNDIQQEHAIADRLGPTISCVYPNLGAILKRVPAFRLPPGIPPEEAEQLYINQIVRTPHLQRHLKIGSSFVFFMNLSKHQFFNQVITSMHKVKDQVHREIVKNGPEAFSDYYSFETLYGADNDRLYFDLHSLARSYENSIEEIVGKAGDQVMIPEYEKQEIFFHRLAGLRKNPDSAGNPGPEIQEEMDAAASRIMQENEPVVKRFQKMVHAVVQQKNFEANRARARALTINILDLIYKLRKRSVAIRDLKPDNLYVAASLDGNDNLLADPDAFELGLIDLETALCYKPDEEGKIPQPLLAATPTYATPSHIFNNQILQAAHGQKLHRIFYMQDWHAAMVMIFYSITGRLPLIKTAKLVPELSRLKKKNLRQPREQLALYKSGSRKFWKTARDEFDYRKGKYGGRLEDVEVILPKHLKKLLAAECERENRHLDGLVQTRIDQCPRAEMLSDKILAASHSKIRAVLEKSEETAAAGSRDPLITLFSEIEPLKHQQAHLNYCKKQFNKPVTCDFIVSFMFDRIFATLNL